MNDMQPYKRLYRSREDRMLAGVCGGIANYANWDPVLVRILFALFFLVGGSALIVYLVMWAIVPLEPEQ